MDPYNTGDLKLLTDAYGGLPAEASVAFVDKSYRLSKDCRPGEEPFYTMAAVILTLKSHELTRRDLLKIAGGPVWSGITAGRVRVTRSGSRQLNTAIHRTAITQARMPGTLGKAYYEKTLAGGKSKTEALRCLKRRLDRVVFNLLTTDHHQTTAFPAAA